MSAYRKATWVPDLTTQAPWSCSGARAGWLLCLLLALVLPRFAGAALVKEVNLWVARDVAPGPKVRITLNTRNVPVVGMAAYRLDGIRWLVRRENPPTDAKGNPVLPPVAGSPVRRWSVSMLSRGEARPRYQQDDYRSRQVNLPALPPGVYLISAGGGDREAWGVVNVTQLSVVVKRAPRRTLAWVTDHDSGRPLPNARVGLFQQDGKRLLSASTGADGVALLATAPGSGQTVIVERGRDLAAVPSAVENPDGVLKMHFQTDRPIYRPGHTVHFKAILRRTQGQGFTPLRTTPCKVEVRDARDNVLDTLQLSTNELGTLSGRTELPAEGVPGPYSVVVSAGQETVYGQFSVAEYRKPEFKAALKPVRKRYLAGEEAVFDLQVSYYFGAPLPQAEVTYQVRRSGSGYYFYDETASWYAGGDGNLYPRDTYSAQAFVAEGKVYTDDAGKATLRFKTDPNAPDSTYSVTCTVRDAARREVEVSGSVPVYAASIRLGLQSELQVVPLGGVLPVKVRVVDLDGKPAAARVTLRVTHHRWVEKKQQYEEHELTRTTVQVPASGTADARLPANAMGDLRIVATATDTGGRSTSSELSLWVASEDYRPEKELEEPQLDLRLDRRVYTPGQTALIAVGSNTRNRPVLLTLEGADLWEHRVLPAGRTRFLWRLKTDLRHSPNAYVGAAQWTRAGLLSANQVLAVPDASRKITVKIEPDRAGYRPGEAAGYLLRTTDAAGNPVSAEAAVAVVDESIYAVRPDSTPDPHAFFWGLRPNLTLTAFSAPEEVSGGAYQRSNELAPVRERFLDTAFWEAHVKTGPDGTARVTFEFPGNLTAWRATALAITEDSRVGRTTSTVQVSRPVMLRLALPRLIVQGDQLTLVGTVHNRTDREREFAVGITGTGIGADGALTKRVTVPAGGERSVSWKLLADLLPESGAAQIEGTAVALDAPQDQRAELSDRLRVPLRVVPNGIARRIAVGGAAERERVLTLTLPPNRIEPATTLTLSVRAGLGGALQEAARSVFQGQPYGSLGAADQLLAAASFPGYDRKALRDALALLSRFQKPQGGWGWWDNDPSDPQITAHVLSALAEASTARVPVTPTLLQRGIEGARQHFAQTNLWEHRALLASALAKAGFRDAGALLEEVLRRGTHMSPFARLRLAEALAGSGKRAEAVSLALEVLKTAKAGPETAFVPAGERPGWSATTAETTAAALLTAVRLELASDLQRKLAERLARPEDEEWRTTDEQAWTALALAAYTRLHPDPSRIGEVRLLVNDRPVTVPEASADGRLRVPVPRALFRDGENRLALRRTGPGEVFFAAEARVFQPAVGEQDRGVRVLRKLETRSASGIWQEVDGAVPTSEPVRVTVVVWPDEQAEWLRVSQPIPAGFEFVDSEAGYWVREEVRDGAVVHYLRGRGTPISFRYYLRAESEGRLTALPATAEVLRRPAERGHTGTGELAVAAAGSPAGP